MPRRFSVRFALFALFPLLAGCGSGIRHAAQQPAPQPITTAAAQPVPPAVVPPPPPVQDPVVLLIAESQRHFEAGQKELSAGHVTGAKTEFDKAVDVLLESSY